MGAAAARHERVAGLAMLVLALVLGACTTKTPRGVGASSSPATTATTASSIPVPSSSTSGTRGDGTFGDGCASLPEFGENSLEGLSQEDSLTAAARSPQLSTLVTTVELTR